MFENMIHFCDVYKNKQPCGKDICCRICEKYEQCKRGRCENKPDKCIKFRERKSENDISTENRPTRQED